MFTLSVFLQISLAFFFGCFFGSFLNVVIDRLPRGESFSKGRSHCDSCRHVLRWYDLIPLLSFMYLQGKCRYCHKDIGLQALMVEVITGCLFAITLYFYPLVLNGNILSWYISILYYLFIVSSFIIITVIDIKHGIIPNKIVYSAIVIALIYHLLRPNTISSFLVSGVSAGIFFFFLFAVTRGRGMGFGDVKLAILLGLFLGFPEIIIALYIAFLTGACIALILVVGKKKKFVGGTIPFGPFLVLGAFFAFFYGKIFWEALHLFAIL